MSTDTTSLSMAEHPDIRDLSRGSHSQSVQMRAVHTLALLAGAYAAISAWVVGFESQTPLAVANLIVGAGVVLLTLAVLRDRLHVLAGAYALMGVWLIVAPWAVQNIDHTGAVIVSNVVVGGLIALFGAASIAMGVARVVRR